MQTWFPLHIRERIADITAKYPKGFVKSGVRRSMYRQTSEMERDIAELQLKKYKTCRRSVPKVMRAVGLKSKGANDNHTFLGAAMQLLREAKMENGRASMKKKVARRMSNLKSSLKSSLMSMSSKASSITESLIESDNQSCTSTGSGGKNDSNGLGRSTNVRMESDDQSCASTDSGDGGKGSNTSNVRSHGHNTPATGHIPEESDSSLDEFGLEQSTSPAFKSMKEIPSSASMISDLEDSEHSLARSRRLSIESAGTNISGPSVEDNSKSSSASKRSVKAIKKFLKRVSIG